MSIDVVNLTITTTAATELPLGSKGNLWIFNPQATNKIYLGTDNTVTASNGVVLPDGAVTGPPVVLTGLTEPLWAIAGVGSQAIGIITT